MKNTIRNLLLIFLICQILAVNGLAQEPDEKLAPLKPLLNSIWKGDFRLPDGTVESVVTRIYELIPGGKVIRMIKKNEGKDNWGEGFFYWDDMSGKIACFFIDNNGVFSSGFVHVAGDSLIVEGKMTWPSQVNPRLKQSYDFRNVFLFTGNEKMVDRWYMNAFGPWKPGHVIEFRGSKPNEVSRE